MSPDDAEVPEPRVLLGRYRVERLLGRGGMGEVLLAWDELLDRHVALKRLDPRGEDREPLRRAILKEARRASRVSDRRIAAIYDVVDLHDEVMLVMEYVDGVTLRRRMTEPVPLEEFWSLATQCAEGIAAAHAQGVIHRDLKPENLMLTRAGEIKILDFGIARQAAGAAGTTTSSDSSSVHIAGTPQYMAPEAHVGGVIDERTDIFSLGVVFYELLTGGRPFEGDTYAVVANHILNSTPPAVQELNPAAGEALSRVVTRMLAKHPGDRLASATELLAQLADARRGEGATLPSDWRPALIPESRRSRGRSRGRAVPIGIAAAALAAGALIWRFVAQPGLPPEIHVAILAPGVPGASADFAAFALGAMDFTSARLIRHADTPGFQIEPLASGMEEHVKSAAEARQLLGVNLALVSRLEQTPDVLRARLELRASLNERVLAARTIEVPATQPFEFVDRLYRDSAALLKLEPRAGGAASESGVRGAGTLRFYLQGLGRLRGAEGEPDLRRALQDLELACRAEPEAASARARIAYAQFRLQQATGDPVWVASADSSSREAVALDSTRFEGHWIRAQVLGYEKKSEASLAEYARAAALNPWDDDVALRFARNWARAGNREKEREIYVATIRRRPHDWKPYWWLAHWQLRDNQIDSCVATYEKLIRRAPDLYRGYANLGGLLVWRGDYERAIGLLRHSVGIKPSRDAYSNLGTAYFNTRKLDEAVEAYNQALQFGEADCVTWLNLGDAYYFLRARKQQAADAFAEGVRLGREEIASRARRGSSFDAEISAVMASVFPKLGQPDSARVYLAQALAANSAGMRVQYHAALTSWQLGERPRAVEWLARAVASGYPKAWIKDSPVFDEWREIEGFRALVADTVARQSTAAARNTGG